MNLTLLAQSDRTIFMPEPASTIAGTVDGIFYFIFYVSLFFFVLIVGLMFFFIVRYRQRTPGEGPKTQITHNTPLEILWSVLPTFLLVAMFWLGFVGFLDMRTVPKDAYEIRVDAKKWTWEFIYPNGIGHPELHVPVDRPVRLVMYSQDVIHSCYIPAFRVKRDVVPGRYSELWFTANKVGEYRLVCAEYCGEGHSDMFAKVVVHPAGTFEDWLATADPLSALSDEQYVEFMADPQAFIDKYKDDPEIGENVQRLKVPALLGKALYEKKGCSQCHTIDGTDLPDKGPTWKGLFGKTETFSDGSSVVVDRDYIAESIREPGKRIVAGRQNIMPKPRVSDRELRQIVEFIKSLQSD